MAIKISRYRGIEASRHRGRETSASPPPPPIPFHATLPSKFYRVTRRGRIKVFATRVSPSRPVVVLVRVHSPRRARLVRYLQRPLLLRQTRRGAARPCNFGETFSRARIRLFFPRPRRRRRHRAITGSSVARVRFGPIRRTFVPSLARVHRRPPALYTLKTVTRAAFHLLLNPNAVDYVSRWKRARRSRVTRFRRYICVAIRRRVFAR